MFYEGLDQALAYALNPLSSPLSSSFAGSVFDLVYLVHPAGSGVEKLADLIQRCTPVGLIVVDHQGSTEVVTPQPNPYLDVNLKRYFLEHLDAFKAYTKYRVNPIQ